MFASVLALLMAPTAARAAEAPPVEDAPVATCVLPAQPGMTARQLLATPGRFDCTTPQRAFGSGDFWVLSQPLPTIQTRARSPLIRTGSVWQQSVTLYVLYANGAIRQTGYTSATTGEHLRLGARIAVRLPRHDAAKAVRLLWHIRGAANLRGIVLGATLIDPARASEQEVVLGLLYGAFAGMALALVIYNLALWAVLRQAYQPVYCLLLLCLLGYAASTSGALGMALPWLDNNDRLRANGILLGGAGASVLYFARTFFEAKVFAGRFRWVCDGVGAALIGSGLLYALASPWHIVWLDRMVIVSFASLVALIPVVLYRAWRARSNFLWLFAIAWGAPILLTALRIGHALGLLPWSLLIDNLTLVSMAIEATASSLAIAYRIHLLSRERDEARTQEIAARLLAATDPLTGLLNRRAFLEGAIGREGNQMLLLADLDHFKTVNETIGHDGGDEVLRVFARVLRASVPAEALVARLGGEEFAIVAPVSANLSATLLLDRLRAARMPYDLTVTASIGSCIGELTDEIDWKAMYRCADRALFEAKAAGRDRARASLAA
ncbi:diguanylate cyclase (GGDEF)-like protein [Sphingomonas jinjuensis]|uniref:diguanylate cyclase n=1 Tax=Sphingomonas jinjuensis TaxID=535907 RepID=A0A840F6F2_9SPHN|nr:diguanylate cyclase [Sphingomonas jinjuensis]MBB4154853.1 diguanylate cyclase (GGDEF)-like protein [Sphingomonas jinjuensis]